MKQSYLTERDRQLSKPLVTTVGVLALVALKFAPRLASAAQERSMFEFVLVLLALAGLFGFWFLARKA